MQQETLRATKRQTAGTRASKRLRREGRVPGVVYGTTIDPIAIHVSSQDLYSVLHTDAGLNAIIEVDIDGESVLTVARELYRHPVRGDIDHLDFIQVRLDVEIEADVAMEYVGIPIGVLDEEGLANILEPTLTISALPNAIPSAIEVAISHLQLHDTMTVGDLPRIDGVTYLAEDDHAVVTIGQKAAEIVEEVIEELEDVEGEEGEEEADEGAPEQDAG